MIDIPDQLTLESTDEALDAGAEWWATITPAPIADGSQVLAHDGYDVQEFSEALQVYSKLATTVQEGQQRLITATALIRDLFWSFLKRAPMIGPVVPLTQAHQVNAQIVEQVLGTVEWRQVREAGTVGDLLNSALATIGVATTALAALDESTIARVNHLHEMESGATDLFARAEALDELATQAEGDRAAQLYAQAQQARQQAAQQRADAEATAAELESTSEDREDAVRRAGRRALAAVEQQIDEANAAINTYTGRYGGGGLGLGQDHGPLTTKEKIALASQVGRSRRLKEIAALCGRFTRIALQVQRSKVKHPPDEITSITTGSDLARLLPSEISLLTDSTLEDLFFLKFADGRLMQYDLIGNEKQGQGPIVVALDSSGSMTMGMGGMTKEVWSKAVTLALLAIARLQGRDMAVLHFSGRHELATYQFMRGQGSYTQVVACVDHFYGGGTVFEPWMHAALHLVDSARFDRADVICISDGLTSIDELARAEWQRRRESRGMRAYGVLIGTQEGAGVLASVTDALMTLDNLQADMPVLETIFSV